MNNTKAEVSTLKQLCLEYITSTPWRMKRCFVKRKKEATEIPGEVLEELLDYLQDNLTDETLSLLISPSLKRIHLPFVKYETEGQISRLVLKRISEECIFLEELVVDQGHHVSDEFIQTILQNCSQLQTLHFRGHQKVRNICTEASLSCTALREVDLLGCKRISDTSMRLFASSCFSSLQMLSLKACFTEEDTLLHVVQNSTGLQKLVLADLEECTDAVISSGDLLSKQTFLIDIKSLNTVHC